MLAALALLIVTPLEGRSQESIDSKLLQRCGIAPPALETQFLCRDLAASIQLIQPDIGLLLAGGNPILGTASPVAPKFRFLPRIQVTGRINLIFSELPDIRDYPQTVGETVATDGFVVPMPQLDVSVGLFDGLRMATTLDGLFAIELLGSVSSLIFPSGAGFANDAIGMGFGARVGLLRESFTAPGISLSGTYKWIDRVQFGEIPEGDDAQFGLDMRVWSLRAGLSKSFSALGFALTVAYDDYRSDVDFSLTSPTGTETTVVPEAEPIDLSAARWSGFIDVSYIVLFLNVVGEVGWQEAQTLSLPSGGEVASGKLFFSFGIRLLM